MPETNPPPPTENDFSDAALLSAMEHVQALETQPGWIILMGTLKTERDEAVAALIDADSNAQQVIQKLQDTIKRYDWFESTPTNICVAGINVLENQELETVEAEGDI